MLPFEKLRLLCFKNHKAVMSSLLPVLCWNRSSCPQHDSLSHTNVPCKGLFWNSGVYKFEYVLCLIISMRQSRTRSQPFFSITIQIFGPDFWIWPHHEIKNCWILKVLNNGITYLQNLKRIFSNTKTGPVLPRIVRGCPANREYAIPVIEAPNKDSIALWKTQTSH